MAGLSVWLIEASDGALCFTNHDDREAWFSYNSDIADSLWEVYSRDQVLCGVLNHQDEPVDGNLLFHLYLDGESVGAFIEVPKDLAFPALVVLRGKDERTASAA